MLRNVVVFALKVMLVFSLAAFIIWPVRGGKNFLVVVGSCALLSICILLLRKLSGEDTGDRFTTFLVKKFSRRNPDDKTDDTLNPKSKI
jgi:hypothetical protein